MIGLPNLQMAPSVYIKGLASNRFAWNDFAMKQVSDQHVMRSQECTFQNIWGRV